MPKFRYAFSLLAALALCAPALADSFKDDGLAFKDVTIKDIKNGKLVVEVGGNDRTYELAKATNVDIGDTTLTNAENARLEPVKAIEFYRRAITTLRAGRKRVAEARALPLFDDQGRYTDAINAFLDLYQNDPTPGTWELRPKKMPDANSAFLKEAAAAISNKLASAPFKTQGDAQKNLRNLLLEIYVKQGDTVRASEQARLLGVEIPGGGPVTVPPETSGTTGTSHTSETPTVASTGSYVDVETALTAKNYDRALALADAMLPNAKEDTAIRLFKYKAQAYLAQNKLELAAGAYLRITAHYPANIREGSEALLSAAEIQNRLKHPDETQALITQLTTNPRYKDTPAAVKAARITIDRPAAPAAP